MLVFRDIYNQILITIVPWGNLKLKLLIGKERVSTTRQTYKERSTKIAGIKKNMEWSPCAMNINERKATR